MAELVIARNPDPDSSLGYLMWVPVGHGLVFAETRPLAEEWTYQRGTAR